MLIDNGFDEFWALYPKKVARKDALKAWNRIRMTPDLFEKIIAALKEQADTVWFGKSTEYVPHASSWLNGERWMDEVHRPVDPQVDAMLFPGGREKYRGRY